jgi:hypothetical protein
VGEAGIGKTRLLAALQSAIGPVCWLACRCPSYLQAEPFALLRALLRELLNPAPDAQAATPRAVLELFHSFKATYLIK